jgi:hypothetical protein
MVEVGDQLGIAIIQVKEELWPTPGGSSELRGR